MGARPSAPTFAIATSSISAPKRASGSRSTAARTGSRSRTTCRRVSVHDIRMQPQYDDLVIATHGRGVYVMDDVRPVQELQQAVSHRHLALYAAHGLRVVAARKRRRNLYELRGRQSAVRRDDHVLPEGAAEERAGARHSRCARPRDPQRLGNAQSRRQGRALHLQQGRAQSLHLGFHRQRPGEVERRARVFSKGPRPDPASSRATIRCA